VLTCKEFLKSLNEYLDETEDAEIRQEVERHIGECPNCWVIFDTTKKTLRVYKGMDPQPIPEHVHSRLMDALQKKMTKGKKSR
jgi:anti-sigma factor RsiW